MSDEIKKALWEAIKQPLRLMVLAIIPVLITYFGMFDYQWAIVATLILRMIDSFLHNLAPEGEAGGLTRF